MKFNEVDTRFDRNFYRASYHLIKPMAQIMLGLKTTGSENVPDEGAALIASNHRSGLDIIALPLVLKDRHISVLARDDLFEKRIQGWLFRHWEAVPIKRYDFDREDYRRVNERLEAGRLVGIFPENTRGDRQLRRQDQGANLAELNPGVAAFAKRYKIDTYPVAISGLDYALSREHFQHRRARVAIGEPIEPPLAVAGSKKIFLAELRQRIEALYDQTLEM